MKLAVCVHDLLNSSLSFT